MDFRTTLPSLLPKPATPFLLINERMGCVAPGRSARMAPALHGQPQEYFIEVGFNRRLIENGLDRSYRGFDLIVGGPR